MNWSFATHLINKFLRIKNKITTFRIYYSYSGNESKLFSVSTFRSEKYFCLISRWIINSKVLRRGFSSEQPAIRANILENGTYDSKYSNRIPEPIGWYTWKTLFRIDPISVLKRDEFSIPIPPGPESSFFQSRVLLFFSNPDPGSRIISFFLDNKINFFKYSKFQKDQTPSFQRIN